MHSDCKQLNLHSKYKTEANHAAHWHAVITAAAAAAADDDDDDEVRRVRRRRCTATE